MTYYSIKRLIASHSDARAALESLRDAMTPKVDPPLVQPEPATDSNQ